jgi:hypothetical protein
VRKCPLEVRVEGAVPNSTVFWALSAKVIDTQRSGDILGFNADLNLYAIVLGGFAPPFRGVAGAAGGCGTGTYSLPTGLNDFPAGLPCYELGADGLVVHPVTGLQTFITSNVVQIP